MEINIRSWHQNDMEVVRYILRETWKDAYSSFIPVDDLLGYFNKHYTANILTEQYQDKNVRGYIAGVDDVIAGYEKICYNELESRLYVQQLYILPAYQKLGLGRKLMKSAADLAVSLGCDKVWLGVMVQNESAVAWYKKMGYTIVETAPFTMGKTTVDHYIGFVPVEGILAGGK